MNLFLAFQLVLVADCGRRSRTLRAIRVCARDRTFRATFGAQQLFLLPIKKTRLHVNRGGLFADTFISAILQTFLPTSSTMAAITTVDFASTALHQLAKREKNWAQREVGVVVVLCIVFIGKSSSLTKSGLAQSCTPRRMSPFRVTINQILMEIEFLVAIGLSFLFIYKKLQKRKAAKATF